MTQRFLSLFVLVLSFFKALSYIQNYNDSFSRTQWDVLNNSLILFKQFSIISYCKQDLIKSWTCGQKICGLHNVTDIQVIYQESYNILGYALYYPSLNSIQVILRGTMPLSLKDMLKDDADLFLEAYPYCIGCQVETGFWQSFQAMEAELVMAVKKLRQKYTEAKINLAGHSLGAAYAAMNTEVFYDYSSTSYKICDETEDPKCSDQYPIELCDIVPGHVYYMGKDVIPFLLSCSDGINFYK